MKKHFKKLFAFTCLVKPFARFRFAFEPKAQSGSKTSQTKFRFAHSYGFTLAEVLITLSILGVVAAITVPSLIKRQHRNETITRLKKASATFETAFDISIAENGPNTQWKFDDEYDMAKKYLIPYLNVTGDIPDEKVTRWTVTNPKTGAVENNSASTYLLKDGMGFGVAHSNMYEDGSTKTGLGDGFIFVDLNGKKGPNQTCKDVHAFYYHPIVTGKRPLIRPYEDSFASRLNYVNNSADVSFCTSVIIKNGFKIPDGYKWL